MKIKVKNTENYKIYVKAKKIKVIDTKELFNLNKYFKSDISILAISGYKSLEYLTPIFSNSKILGIVSKESIVSAGHLFHTINNKNKTKVYPLDSEHYSLKSLLNSSLLPKYIFLLHW